MRRKTDPIQCETCPTEFVPKSKSQKYCSSCSAIRPRDNLSSWVTGGKSRPNEIKAFLMESGWDGRCMVIGCGYNKTTDIHRFVEGRHGGQYEFGNVFAICPNHHAEVHRKITKFRIISEMELEAV